MNKVIDVHVTPHGHFAAHESEVHPFAAIDFEPSHALHDPGAR